MSRVLIDTNIYSEAMRGTPDICQRLRCFGYIAISTVSVGELLSGFKAGSREKENQKEMQEFIDSPRVDLLSTDYDTAAFYAQVLNDLKTADRPIPTNDIWIAATAFAHGLPLLTLDRHFSFISGLRLA